jgi:flagellar biosynthesis protein FlhF
MNLKTFQADSMQEALTKVRDELGPEAVIVKTRQVARKSLGRQKTSYEVTAAAETVAVSPAKPAPAAKAALPAGEKAGLKPIPAQYDWTGRLPRMTTKEIPAPVPPGTAPGNLEDLREEIRKVKEQVEMPTRELRQLREEIQAMLESAAAPSPAGDDLRAADFPPALANSLRHRAGEATGSHSQWRGKIAGLMAGDLHCAGGIRLKAGRATRVLFTGPAGAGKTALIQKLAAQGRLNAGKRVGLISADRRRLGAQGEFGLFAKTLGLPMACVFDAREIPAALHALRACQLILVDAPSHPAGETGWRELEELARTLVPDETHLVLNACTRERELRQAVAAFARLRPNRLSLTRLDECLGVGAAYAAAHAFSAPLAYLASGPACSENIETAAPETLARWFRRGLNACLQGATAAA